MNMDDRPGIEDHALWDAINHIPPIEDQRRQKLVDKLGDALANLLYAHNQTLADRIFERIEKRIVDLVDVAAKRVVPKNIRGLIETIVNLRSARLDDRDASIRFELTNLETRLLAEIARAIETPFPEPVPERKPRKKAKPRRQAARRK